MVSELAGGAGLLAVASSPLKAHRTRLLPSQPAPSLPAVLAPHLLDSCSGPTGDLLSSSGELDSITSSSRLRLSFLSSPASLPAAQQQGAAFV